MTPACEWVRQRLPEAVAGDLDPEAAEAVAQHVAACADCARAHARIASILAAAARIEPPPLSPSFTDAVMARVADERTRAIRVSPWRWVAAVAATAVLAVGLIVLTRHFRAQRHRHETEPDGQVALLMSGLEGSARSAGDTGGAGLEALADAGEEVLAAVPEPDDVTVAGDDGWQTVLTDSTAGLDEDLADVAREAGDLVSDLVDRIPWL